MNDAAFGGAAAAALLVTLVVAAPAASQEESEAAPALEGRALIDENCLYCHDDSYIRSLNLERSEWEEVLDLMIGMGMPPLEPEVQERVLDYLEEEHGVGGEGPGASGGAAGPASPGSETPDLPWAFPRYRPNPLVWREVWGEQ